MNKFLNENEKVLSEAENLIYNGILQKENNKVNQEENLSQNNTKNVDFSPMFR